MRASFLLPALLLAACARHEAAVPDGRTVVIANAAGSDAAGKDLPAHVSSGVLVSGADPLPGI